MPYSITTKDGITIQNIPDDIKPDDPILKQRVAGIRSSAVNMESQPEPEPDYQAPSEQVDAITQDDGGFDLNTVIEPALTFASGAIAEPIAGLSGIGMATGRGVDAGVEAIKDVRESLTYEPRTEAGKAGLKAAGEFLSPIAEWIEGKETSLGDAALEAWGSPAIAAAASTIPTAIMELFGVATTRGAFKVGKAAKSKSIQKSVVEAAPEIEGLKNVSRSIYKELDDSGVRIKPDAYLDLASKIEDKMTGFMPEINPKTAGALKAFRSRVGGSPTLTEIDNLRKVAQNVSRSIDPSETRFGSIMIQEIDNFLDDLRPNQFDGGGIDAAEIGGKYKAARELWGRARRSELVTDAMDRAKDVASGFENGLRIEFRKIVNNRKKSRFFKPAELDAMRTVIAGTKSANIAKLIGRLGFSEGNATNILGGSVGVAAGASFAGAPGAVAVPIIGQVSRKLAARLTAKNAIFADAIIRAGPDATEIVRLYQKHIPRAQRTVSDLSDLLMMPVTDLASIGMSTDRLVREAAEIARGRRFVLAGIIGAGVETQQKKGKEE
jgi:hypothetical protein